MSLPITKSAIFSAIVAVMLMASVPVIIKLISANELQIGIIRLLIGAVVLFFFLRLKQYRWRLSYHEWGVLLLLGCLFGLHWYTYFKGIKLSTPSIAAIGVGTFGIHLVIMSHLFLKQPIRSSDWLAIALALFGLYLVVPTFEWQSEYFQGLVYSVVSGMFYACLPIIHQKASQIPNNVRAWGQFSFALIPFLFFGHSMQWELLTAFDWKGLIYLGIIATLVAHSLWVKATTELPATVTSMIYYLYVPVAMLLSFWFFNESFDLQKIVGAGIIVLANLITIVVRWKGITSITNVRIQR